jgi:predicted KAP-like P-loop ATPase
MPVLVVLDDLDRLTPDELPLVFKLVRLVGRLPNVYYLLRYDERTLLDVLRRTDLVGDDEARGRDHLEKMVQVRLDLAPGAARALPETGSGPADSRQPGRAVGSDAGSTSKCCR